MLSLVRHGESEANAGQITSDSAVIRLTPRGHAQAIAVAGCFHEPPARVVLSRYIRARQTSRPLLEKFPGIKVLESNVEEFTYLAMDRCINTNAAMRQPMVDAYWERMDPSYRDGEGAESFADFYSRAITLLESASEWTGITVVFTHEQFIRAVLLAVLYDDVSAAIQMRRFFALRTGLTIPNGGIVRFEYRSGCWWNARIEQSHLIHE